MLNCGAIITRTGQLNSSGSMALASRGISVKRPLSTISRNKFLRSQLLDSSSKILTEVRNVNASHLSTSCIILKSTQSPYLRFLRLRNIQTHPRAQCSTCTTDVKKKVEITEISKITRLYEHYKLQNEIINEAKQETEDLADNFGNFSVEHSNETEHHKHARHHAEAKLPEIEKLYGNPKAKLNDIYVSVGSQLKMDKLMVVEFVEPNKQRRLWTCHYSLRWPEKVTISGVGSSKHAAAKVGALKALQWLHNTGKLKDGYPVVYDSKIVTDMLNKPTAIEIGAETLLSMKNLLNRYNEEIVEMVKKNNELENMRDISVSSENITDPVGRSLPEAWQEPNISQRNETLKDRQEDRAERIAKELPITQYRDEIIKEIEASRALLIKGDTGCGKTTQVPQYIMESFEAKGRATDCNMIISQPRRISAISLAERIADERSERVGDVVGYQVRLQQIFPHTPGGMLFCTTGILLRKLQTNPNLEGCSHVILDEAHERSINTDMLLVLLKRALIANPQLKVIVMSATINADLFQRYFDCGVVQVPGRTYPVEMHFLDDVKRVGIHPTREYVGDEQFPDAPYVDCEMIGQLIRWIDKRKPPGAILCFLPGWAEIVKVKKYLEEHRQRGSYDFIVPVHSRMAHQDQRKIFQRPPAGSRKIVLATDIAETGITVTDVVYVVDSATQKAMRWHEKKGFASMENQYASQANILQRKGRAGRVTAGESYHFVTKEHFENLEVHPLPEVLRSSLEKTVLDCKTYSNEKVESFLGSMPQPPTLSAVRKAIRDLREIGALDGNENLTPLGKRIALFTVHPKLSKAIVYSSIFQCVSPMVTIASAMSADSEIFTGTLYDKATIREVKQKYHPASDHISVAWLYTQWASYNRRGRDAARQFCWNSKLVPERMFTLSKVRELNAESLVHCHMMKSIDEFNDPKSNLNEYFDVDELVRAVLLAGLDQLLYQRDFELKKNKVKKGIASFTMEDGTRATLTPESVNFKRTSWPSPFLTYVRRQHSEVRRTSLIRETSMVSPITALLFSQGEVHGRNLAQAPNASEQESTSNTVLLTVKGRKNIRLSCTKETASLLLAFRDSMWSVVRYLIERQGLVENMPDTELSKVEKYKEHMLQVLVHMLSEASEKIDEADATAKRGTNDNDDEELSD